MRNKITTLLNKYIFVFVLLTFFASTSLFAQTISAVTNGSPAHGGTTFQRCDGSNGTLAYWSTFTTSGSFGAGNTFKLELSDASGAFTTPTLLSNTPTLSGSTGEFSFFLPAGTYGTGYKLRVTSSNPIISATSNPIPSYYKSFPSGFFINNKISTVNICGSGSFPLSIDNGPLSNDSPADYPALKYKWYKGTTVIAGQTGTSINVSSSGVYRVFIDYGTCSTFNDGQVEKSQSVTVNIVASGATFAITSSLGNTFCSSSSTTLSTDAGYAYQWFRDGNSIPGATAFNYVTNQPGSYTVVVNQGSCSSTSNALNISTTTFNASIDVHEEPLTNIIAAGESKTITVTTDAASPTYEWYLDGVLLPETTNVLSTNIVGNYKVIIKQTTGCLSTKEFLFELKEGINPKAVPNLISPNADGKNDTWILPQEYINASTDVLIINPKGEVDFQTVNYQNNWPVKEIDFKSVNPVYYYIISKDGSPIKKGSITIIK
jgi:hypothetical protein